MFRTNPRQRLITKSEQWLQNEIREFFDFSPHFEFGILIVCDHNHSRDFFLLVYPGDEILRQTQEIEIDYPRAK